MTSRQCAPPRSALPICSVVQMLSKICDRNLRLSGLCPAIPNMTKKLQLADCQSTAILRSCLGKIRTLTGGTRIRRATITPQGNFSVIRLSCRFDDAKVRTFFYPANFSATFFLFLQKKSVVRSVLNAEKRRCNKNITGKRCRIAAFCCIFAKDYKTDSDATAQRL